MNPALSKPFGIHWFRRDLRIAGNPGLRENWLQNHGRVLGLFCFDASFLRRPDFSSNRFAFFLKTLQQLKSELMEMGGDLLVVDAEPRQAFSKIIEHLQHHDTSPSLVTYNRDYEPFARQRDAVIDTLLHQLHIRCCHYRDHLVIEPEELLAFDKRDSFYKVYTPFSKKWLACMQTSAIAERITPKATGLNYLIHGEKNPSHQVFGMKWHDLPQKHFPYSDALEHFIAENNKNVDIPIPAAGAKAALTHLSQFATRLKGYDQNRDIPALDSTSRLSMFLKNGSITVAQIIAFLGLNHPATLDFDKMKLLKELIWREFYYAILYFRPDVESTAFNEKYADLAWENNEGLFKKWRLGETGYPIVDAAMRQLNETGWMHNRLRMIVASFLTKDLLIDWRWGENYFMSKLLDGDLAPNNGGWQWAASTGVDAQPYFRVFNPWLQSKRFDPQGLFIRRFVPELAKLQDAQLHAPLHTTAAKGYAAPIVRHEVQKLKAIHLFKRNV